MLQDLTPEGGGPVATTAGAAAPRRATVQEHRYVVVRRLLARGLSPGVLEQILPGWSTFAPRGPLLRVADGCRCQAR